MLFDLISDNSDLLAVTVANRGEGSGKPQRRFLVVDVFQIVLVEPDSSRLGWGVATFVGFLQVSVSLEVKYVYVVRRTRKKSKTPFG